MKHFILSSAPNADGIIRLYEKNYHYLVRVRRLRSGDCFDALLPDGENVKVQILSTKNKILIGKCLEAGQLPVVQEKIPPIALFQGLPKGNKMDLIVRQAAEGGISLIVPFQSEHSSSHLDKSSNEKIKRWERIILEARQQSGSAIETEIRPPCNPDLLLEYWNSIKKEYSRPIGIIFHQEPLARKSFHGYLGNNPDYVVMVVGPEGGFSAKELVSFMAAGFMPLLMGNTILRTETAALYGAAIIRILLLEKEEWTPSLKESCS